MVGLDREASRVEALLLEHGDRILFAVGDVFLEETLLAARLERAHALVVALADDRDNLLLCVTARQVNPSIRLVVRLVDPDNASLFEGAHADAIVHSPRVAAKTIASDLLNPALSDFTHRLITSESHRKPLELLTVSPDDAAVGQPLDALVFGHKGGGMIVAHRRAGDARFAFRPEGSRLVEGGDELLLLASREERRHRNIAPRATTSNGASPLGPPEARHAVLAGAGAVGRALAKELRHRGIRVSVIERDAAKLALLRDALGDDPDLHLVCGDVYDKHALSEAGLERAWAFVSALQAVRDNLFLAATVHHQHPHLRIVARVGSRREARRMEAFGAEAFNPGAIGGVHLGRLAIHPELVAFADGLEASLERTEALAILPVTRPGLDGSRLRELPTGDLGAVVVGLRRKKSGHFVYHPDPAMRLSVGGAVVALGEAHALEALSAFLGG
ncbi:MAG: NAD-binding protein [Deltaproteobacteria bacterium]|nr:NAD-binding protein [Deltaproteobacteria bacterium]